MNPILAVGTDNGVVAVRPSGDSWALHAHGLYGHQVPDLLGAPDGGAYACAAKGTVYRTRDWEQWSPLFEGLTANGVSALAEAGGVLYAGTTPPNVFLSSDEGRQWSALAGFTKVSGRDGWTSSVPPYKPRVSRLAWLPGGVLVAGIEEGGVLVSPDAGRRWTERWNGLPAAVSDLAVAGRSTILVTTRLGIFRSDDAGGFWTALKAGLPYDLARGISLDPGNPNLVLAAIARTPTAGAALVRSQDGGKAWEVTNRGLPAVKDELFTCVHCGPGLQFAGTDKGQLFCSRDFGGFWSRVGLSFPPIRSLRLLEAS